MVTWEIMVIALVGIVVQFATRKIKEEKKPGYLVSIQYGTMILIVVLGAYSQYMSSVKEEEYRVAKLKIDVLSNISKQMLPVFEDMITIQNNFITVKNYLSYQKAKKNFPELPHVVNWRKDVSKKQIAALHSAKNAFHKIQSIAAEIIKLAIEYDELVPQKTLDWASATIKMKFEDIEMYLDPYASVGNLPAVSVISYFKKTGEAFGVVIGQIKLAVHTIRN